MLTASTRREKKKNSSNLKQPLSSLVCHQTRSSAHYLSQVPLCHPFQKRKRTKTLTRGVPGPVEDAQDHHVLGKFQVREQLGRDEEVLGSWFAGAIGDDLEDHPLVHRVHSSRGFGQRW